MMLSAAKSSVQSGEGNGLLNNNTLDVLKSSQLMDTSSSQSRAHLTVYREIRPISSLASISNVNTPSSTPSSTNDGSESGGRSEQGDELSNDKFNSFVENSTKVAGTWCPPIQALSSQTASLFPETNGKKTPKTSRELKDNIPNVRSESAMKIPNERIVRAPCVKLEPQTPQKSVVYQQTPSVHKCNGVNPVVSVPLIKKEDPIVVSVHSEAQSFTGMKGNNSTETKSSTSGVNNFVTSVNSVKTAETLDKKTFFLAVTPTMHQNIHREATSPLTENLMENERFTPASPVPADGSVPTRKPCNCTKSSCLKLYCECFAQGITCSKCNCANCMNNEQHEEERSRAIKMILVRNPAAFQSKIERSYGHVKGCNCKKSNCLKNYCECYEAKMACTSLCRCLGCQNTDHSQAMEIVRRSVYAKIMNKDTPSGIYNSPSTSSSVPENSMEANIVHYSDLKRTIVKQPNMCDSSIDTTNATQFADKMNNQNKKSRFSDSTVIVSTSPISPMDEKDKTFATRTEEPQSPRSNSLKRIRSNALDRRNVASSTSGTGTSIDGASNKSSEEASSTKAQKPQEGMVNLNQTIDDVVAAYVIPESRRQKTVPCSSLSLPIAKRARISVGAESGMSGGSSCNSSTHFSLPLSDDVSSDTSGPREDEFTAEEIALMKGIRGRFSNTTDTPPTSTNPAAEDDTINTSADERTPENTFQKMVKNGQSETADVGEGSSISKQIDSNDVPISDCLSVSTASSSERQEDTSRRTLAVLPDSESPNILSFLQSSQLQIESAINGSASGVKGTCATPLATNVPNSTSGGSKLLYSILNPSSRVGLVPPPGGVHRASSTFRPLTVATASVLNGNNNGCGNSNGNSGSVVHWRPQPQPTTSSLPISQQQQSQSPQQFSPVLSPDVTVVQSTTLSQLSDLVDGENGLRAQVTALERQVSEMRRSQLHQTRMLTAIHRALIRRQSHQTIGLSHWNSISSSSSSTSSFLQRRRRRFRWRLPRDGCKNI